MDFRFRRLFKNPPGTRLAGYATLWTARNGWPLTLDLVAILLVALAVLMMAA